MTAGALDFTGFGAVTYNSTDPHILDHTNAYLATANIEAFAVEVGVNSFSVAGEQLEVGLYDITGLSYPYDGAVRRTSVIVTSAGVEETITLALPAPYLLTEGRLYACSIRAVDNGTTSVFGMLRSGYSGNASTDSAVTGAAQPLQEFFDGAAYIHRTYSARVLTQAASVTASVTVDQTSAAFGSSITWSTAGLGSITSATLNDGTNTISLSNITDTGGDIPSLGDGVSRVLTGDVLLTVGDGTSTASDTFTLTVPSGYSTVSLASGFATDETTYLYNYSNPSALVVGAEFIWQSVQNSETLTLNNDGSWSTSGAGSFLFYGIDPADGLMEAGTLTVAATLIVESANSTASTTDGAITQTHGLLAENSLVESESTIQLLVQTQTLVAANTETQTAATLADVSQVHTHEAANAESSTEATTGATQQTHSLASANATSTAAASVGAVVAGSTHNLSALNAQCDSSGTDGTLTQTQTLLSVNANANTNATSEGVNQTHTLVASKATTTVNATVGAVVSGDVHNLTSNNASLMANASDGFVTQVFQLTGLDSSISSELSTASVAQVHVLFPVNATVIGYVTSGAVYNVTFDDVEVDRLLLVSATKKFSLKKVS